VRLEGRGIARAPFFLHRRSREGVVQRIEIDMSREWLIMLEDYCVKAETGQQIPPEDVNAMGDFLSALSATVKMAEANVKRRA
jgi:hypothetical protein